MGKEMNSTDYAFGFIPYGPILRSRIYAVLTAPTINVCINDLVVHGGTGVVTPKGTKNAIEDGAVPDGNPSFLGGVLSVFNENMEPIQYIAPARVGNGTIAGYVLVADSPDQLYLAQEDGDTNAIDVAEMGQNADIISATLCAPNTTTFMGTQEIDSTSAGTSADLNVKLVEPHMDDTIADDDNPYARWIVQVNEHYYGDTMAGL